MVDARLERTVGDAAYHVVVGGSGPPVLLLHGFPQTHLCWDRVAPALAERHTVVLADLRGYGASTAPPGGPRGEGYTKREMAAELVQVMAGLGHERYAVVGHDRGARVGYRMALDHPGVVDRLAVLNVIPTLDQFERMSGGPSLATGRGCCSRSPRRCPSGCWAPTRQRCSTTSSPRGPPTRPRSPTTTGPPTVRR
jgi:pimeloyl-ACP methyl ester carboxylesterase